MKKTIMNYALTSLLVVLLPSAALAAEPVSKVAVVDIQRAVLQTEQAQKSLEDLKNQADFKTNMKELEDLEKAYQDMVAAYQKDRAVMSAEKRDAEERSILDKQKI